MNTKELMPCPFCGSNDTWTDSALRKRQVLCNSCEASGPTEETDDEAIDSWNRLAALPSDAAQAPQGWKLVPIEPTVSMVVDGFESEFRFRESAEYAAMAGCRGAAEAAKVCYRAMLGAAPVAPAAAAPEGFTLVPLCPDDAIQAAGAQAVRRSEQGANNPAGTGT